MESNKRKENTIFYLYVANILNDPIIKSQVLNWIEVLQDQGIIFNILSCPSILYLIKHKNRQKTIIKEFQSKLKGKIYQITTLRSLDKFDFISPVLKAMYILFIIYKEGRNKNITRIILQSRAGFNYKAFKILKKLNNKIKVVFDFRGAAPEEYLNSLAIDDIAQVENSLIKRKYAQLVRKYADIINFGDLIYCVSDALKSYLLNMAGVRECNNKIYAVPGAADENIFYYDSALRAKQRKELGLGLKRIIIYTGRLKSKYHKKESIFEFAAKFVGLDPSNYFICLTPDENIAKELTKSRLISEDKILIKSINNHAEINQFLNAADIGIILRDDVATNQVASPTKLAEYLLAGLPVLVSEHIGDYSDFIRANDLGMVVNNDIAEMILVINRFEIPSPNRIRNSEIAKARFSKQANLAIIKTALSGL
ncbi:MAG: hypothetical protein JW925_10840 [Syntrophaceae bacterium]|nr:hypothetical protein [Syntrophaceae bacterium]